MSSIVKLNITSRTELAKLYIQQFKYGGVFVAGKLDYSLGEDVFLLINLPESSDSIAVGGKVCWLSPASAVGYPEGMGVQFKNDKAGSDAKSRLEITLGGALQHQGSSYTF
jgi:type IV pilus assembly protein PilZ